MAWRRARASSGVIRPAFRSASMLICLPGMASRVNRAATSLTRPAPLVMTTYWITTRIRKTTMPTIVLPPTTTLPKALMTSPAWALRRTSRAAETLSPRRKSVAIRSSGGNELNSSGSRMFRLTSRIVSENVMLRTIRMSSSVGGSGTIIIATMPTTAAARKASLRPSTLTGAGVVWVVIAQAPHRNRSIGRLPGRPRRRSPPCPPRSGPARPACRSASSSSSRARASASSSTSATTSPPSSGGASPSGGPTRVAVEGMAPASPICP